MRASLFFLLVLAGCGSGGQDQVTNDNHGYGFAYDAQTSFKLRYTPALTTDNVQYALLSDPTFYESEFKAVEACSHLSAPMPPFIIVTTLEAPTAGLYMSPDPLILIDANHLSAIRHEMVHYLLDMTSGSPDPDHSSVFFRSCS